MLSLMLHANIMNLRVTCFNCYRHGMGISTMYFRSLYGKPHYTTFDIRMIHMKREDYNKAEVDVKKASKNIDFANKLRELHSVDGILGFVDKQKIIEPIDVGLTLRRLIEISSGSSLQEDAASVSLSKDDRISKLAQRLESQVLDADTLLFILTSLRQLSCIDPIIVKSVETKVCDLLGQMSISQVVRVIKISNEITLENTVDNARQNMKLNSNAINNISKDILNKSSVVGQIRSFNLCDEALLTLERRWVEISNPQDIVTLMYVIPQGANDRLWARLYERVLERTEVMSVKDLYRVLYVMARRKQRNDPVVRSVVYHMNKRSLKGDALPQTSSLYSTSTNIVISQSDTPDSHHSMPEPEILSQSQDTVSDASLTLVQLSNLAYACASLNIRDQVLIRSLVDAIKSSFNESLNVDNVHMYSSMLQSLAVLHWLDGDIMDRICSVFMSFAEKITVSQWSSLIKTSSSLGYRPLSLTKETLMTVFERLRGGQEITGYHRALLDIVYSSAILNMMTAEMAALVLSKDFVNSLELSCASNPIPSQLKLLNIDAVVKNAMITEYNGPHLDEDYITKVSATLDVRRHGVLKKTLLDTMYKIANAEKYLRVDVRAPVGYLIDVELLTNDKGQLQPVADYTNNVSPDNSALPPGIYRFAIKLLDVSDMTLGHIQPTGINAICSKYLTAVGYKVIQIPHNEMRDSTTIVKRVQYIQARIMDSIKGTNTAYSFVSPSGTTEGKLNIKDSPESQQRKPEAGSVLPQTKAGSATSVSYNNTLVAARQVPKKINKRIGEANSPKDDSRSNDLLLSSSRIDDKKQEHNQRKSKLKSVSPSRTSVSLDIKELYEEQSTSVKQDKSTTRVKDTKRAKLLDLSVDK